MKWRVNASPRAHATRLIDKDLALRGTRRARRFARASPRRTSTLGGRAVGPTTALALALALLGLGWPVEAVAADSTQAPWSTRPRMLARQTLMCASALRVQSTPTVHGARVIASPPNIPGLSGLQPNRLLDTPLAPCLSPRPFGGAKLGPPPPPRLPENFP